MAILFSSGQQFKIWKNLLRKKRKLVVVLFLRFAQKQHNNK